MAVDGNGNVWTTDVATGNVDRFDSTGAFVQEFPIPSSAGSLAGGIAVDSNHGGALYLILNGNQSGMTVKFTLSGGSPTTIDPSGATALALDPLSGNLFVDHGNNVTVYGPSGAQIGTLPSLGGGTTTSSQGLAYFSKSKSGKEDRLYVGDASNDLVTIYGPRGAGAPFISIESATHAGLMSETLSAGIVPLGKDTTCTFQYVDSADFLVSGYTNAASVPCSPADLGSSFILQTGQALVAGLTAAPSTTSMWSPRTRPAPSPGRTRRSRSARATGRRPTAARSTTRRCWPPTASTTSASAWPRTRPTAASRSAPSPP